MKRALLLIFICIMSYIRSQDITEIQDSWASTKYFIDNTAKSDLNALTDSDYVFLNQVLSDLQNDTVKLDQNLVKSALSDETLKPNTIAKLINKLKKSSKISATAQSILTTVLDLALQIEYTLLRSKVTTGSGWQDETKAFFNAVKCILQAQNI